MKLANLKLRGALGAAILLCLSTAASAQDTKVGDLTIDHAWARATAASAKNGAAYVTVHNHGMTEDRVVSAASAVAKRTELHTHMMEGNIMRMRQVDHVPVPAHGMAEFKPGSYHIMLMGLHHPLEAGSSFPITVTFEKAGSVTIDFKVEAMGAAGMSHGSMGHGQQGHEGHKMKH